MCLISSVRNFPNYSTTCKSPRQIPIKMPNSTAASTSRQPSIAARMSFQQKPVVSISSLKKEKMNTQTAPPSGKSSITQCGI